MDHRNICADAEISNGEENILKEEDDDEFSTYFTNHKIEVPGDDKVIRMNKCLLFTSLFFTAISFKTAELCLT